MPVDYTGATGRLDLARVAELGPRYVIQPKVDGTYCRVHLDARGRIERMYSRRQELTGPQIAEFRGHRIGAPHSQLVGEIELWTESSNRLAATRGYRLIHLFDCIREGRRYIAREPYRVRRDAIYRMQAELTGGKPYVTDAHGDAHERATGKYCKAIPADWRRAPIVEQLPARLADTAWSEWVQSCGGEGLVAVALDAPIGARGAKRKIKEVDTLDAVVLQVTASTVVCSWAGRVFTVSARKGVDAKPGCVVEVCHNGLYESATVPRFPRLMRVRDDLPTSSVTGFRQTQTDRAQ